MSAFIIIAAAAQSQNREEEKVKLETQRRIPFYNAIINDLKNGSLKHEKIDDEALTKDIVASHERMVKWMLSGDKNALDKKVRQKIIKDVVAKHRLRKIFGSIIEETGVKFNNVNSGFLSLKLSNEILHELDSEVEVAKLINWLHDNDLTTKGQRRAIIEPPPEDKTGLFGLGYFGL